MTKTFDCSGMSEAFLNGAVVSLGGRPGKIVKVDRGVCSVDFPDSWLEMSAGPDGVLSSKQRNESDLESAAPPKPPTSRFSDRAPKS